MLPFKVDSATCTKCGLCVLDCPSRIIEMADGAIPSIRPENEGRCIQCQHCLAVCPSAAVSIAGRDPANSLPLLRGSLPTLDQMIQLVGSRRSVRRYRDENVDAELLKRLLAALANVPSGVNRMALTFSVIDDKAAMQRFRTRTLEALAAAAKAGGIPEQHAYLLQAVPAWFEQGVDLIFRGAPHLLVISAAAEAACPQEDVNLALANFELLAHSAGLGALWCGMAKMALELLPELKKTLGLRPGRFYYPMLFGLPAVHYARTVQRHNDARIRHIHV